MEYFLPSSYAVAFTWGIFVLIGMIGMGRLAGRLVDAQTSNEAGWGMHAVWGMTVYLFIGAILATFRLCGAMAITILICAGMVAFIWLTVRDWPAAWIGVKNAPWRLWPAFALAAMLYAGGIVYWGRANPCDDWPCYYYFCDKLLITGSFDEPFSWRRMASLGGHTLLQSGVVAQTSIASASAFELALGPVILLGLISGFRRGALGKTPLGLLIALIALTTPLIRLNSASQMTGIIFFVGLFVTLHLIDGLENRQFRLRWLMVAGFVAAATSSLRAQYIPACGGALGLFWLASWIRDRRTRREMLIELGCIGGAMLVALLPWMIMSYRSNESPLFPLFQGGNKLDFNPAGLHASFLRRSGLPMKMILAPEILPLLLCLFALGNWRRALAGKALGIAVVIASLMVAYSLPLAPDEGTIPRYVQPLLLAGAIAALMTAATIARTRFRAWAFGLLLVAVTIQSRSDFIERSFAILQQSAFANMPYHARDVLEHLKAQALVPEGKRILVCSDYPLLFDQRRNPIWIVDMPNATSPSPGMPFQDPPEKMKQYLRDLGIDYLIYVDFSKSAQLYNRSNWQQHASGDIPLWKIQSQLYLDFFDTVDRLALSEKKLGQCGNLTVLQFSP